MTAMLIRSNHVHTNMLGQGKIEISNILNRMIWFYFSYMLVSDAEIKNGNIKRITKNELVVNVGDKVSA